MDDAQGFVEAACEAIEAGQPVQALEHLIDAWGARRLERIAQPLRSLGAALAIEASPIEGETSLAYQSAWLDRAETGGYNDLDILLETLCEGPRRVTSAAACKRLEALALWPPDPRIARRMVALLREPPFTSPAGFKPFYRQVAELLVIHADPHSIDELVDMPNFVELLGLRTLGRFLEELRIPTVERAWAELHDSSESLPLEFEETLHRLEQGISSFVRHSAALTRAKRTQKTHEDFLAEIHANLSADEPREVYADWLLDRGDPRGEFIRVQIELERRDNPELRRAERRLLNEHRKAWLGNLGPVVPRRGLRFRRGFLDACAVDLHNKPQRLWKGPDGHAALRTISSLEIPTLDAFPSNHPILQQLTCLTTDSWWELERDPPLMLPHLRSLTFALGQDDVDALGDPDVQREFLRPDAVQLPGLRHLGALQVYWDTDGPWHRPRRVAWLFDTEVGRQLTSLGSSIPPKALGRWQEAIHGQAVPIQEFVGYIDEAMWVLNKDGVAHASRLWVDLEFGGHPVPLDRVSETIEALRAESITRIEFVGNFDATHSRHDDLSAKVLRAQPQMKIVRTERRS